MATGINYDGKVVSVGDQVTVIGSGSVSGTGATATVTFVSAFNDAISCKSINVTAPEPSTVSATSQPSGDMVGPVGNGYFSLPGTVTAISGSTKTAQLTVTINDGNSVTVSAGACRSTSRV